MQLLSPLIFLDILIYNLCYNLHMRVEKIPPIEKTPQKFPPKVLEENKLPKKEESSGELLDDTVNISEEGLKALKS